jgi:hypothetical protein
MWGVGPTLKQHKIMIWNLVMSSAGPGAGIILKRLPVLQLFELYKSNEKRVQFLKLIFNVYSVVDKKNIFWKCSPPTPPPPKKKGDRTWAAMDVFSGLYLG